MPYPSKSHISGSKPETGRTLHPYNTCVFSELLRLRRSARNSFPGYLSGTFISRIVLEDDPTNWRSLRSYRCTPSLPLFLALQPLAPSVLLLSMLLLLSRSKIFLRCASRKSQIVAWCRDEAKHGLVSGKPCLER